MIGAPIPTDDSLRVAALDASGLIGTPDDYALDCVTHLAAALFEVPTALISLVDADKQHFKSVVGLELRSTPREVSFCGHVVAKEQAIIVEDALRDIRFADNPMVVGAPHTRFYAGHPIHCADGAVLGALCVIDTKPRKFGAEDQRRLKELAFLVDQSLRAARVSAARNALAAKLTLARRESLIDPMLRTWNRGGIAAILAQQNAEVAAGTGLFSVLLLDIDHFKQVNDRYGHIAGDAVLKAVAQALKSSLRSGDELARFGGDEFLVVLPNTQAADAECLARRLESAVYALRVPTPAGEIRCSISSGAAERAATGTETVEALIHRADLEMLNRKRNSRRAPPPAP
jgi:diguanylate cyclase (GGDEF)-like protein